MTTMTPTPPREPLPLEPWVDPPDLIAARERMREIFARLEELLAARRALENA
jgi:hypothetical protein